MARRGGVLERLKSLFANDGAATRPGTIVETTIVPDAPFFAIGDVHGCADMMADALSRIRAETGGGGGKTILLGDYVDRGPQSARVLTRLFEMQGENPEEIVCLKGNHEVMMLDFIDDPAGRGAPWMKFGGDRTLKSFGIGGTSKKFDSRDAIDIANDLEEAMPEGLQDWLRRLPLQWSSGNMHCVHAAMDPELSPAEQKEEVLLWGHDDFFDVPRKDAMTVVHGHTVVSRPLICNGRISIDTGAYRTGRLTTVAITRGKATFL